mmetsp:Transcript_20972/g.60118  ORF Transcript_20972/g.60118 Transcript_20972/m.60118 type:complete len:337 (-) Transcript_20972:546-1556(-)
MPMVLSTSFPPEAGFATKSDRDRSASASEGECRDSPNRRHRPEGRRGRNPCSAHTQSERRVQCRDRRRPCHRCEGAQPQRTGRSRRSVRRYWWPTRGRPNRHRSRRTRRGFRSLSPIRCTPAPPRGDSTPPTDCWDGSAAISSARRPLPWTPPLLHPEPIGWDSTPRGERRRGCRRRRWQWQWQPPDDGPWWAPGRFPTAPLPPDRTRTRRSTGWGSALPRPARRGRCTGSPARRCSRPRPPSPRRPATRGGTGSSAGSPPRPGGAMVGPGWAGSRSCRRRRFGCPPPPPRRRMPRQTPARRGPAGLPAFGSRPPTAAGRRRGRPRDSSSRRPGRR